MKILKNSKILITGGTGSFGKAVINKFLNFEIKELRIFSRDEKKQNDMRMALNDHRVKFYIGDVRDKDSVFQVMKGIDYVFHAAALKQVPSCEFYPMEALLTNVIGTENILLGASSMNVKKVIFLSTDKAVYPINAMGLSKAFAEKLVIAKSRMQSPGDTIFCATRYGNVLASRGSVIPLFISQIKSNSPLTVTDPNMTRFLMTLEESVDLVLYALSTGEQGDIFVQKSPASTVGTIAESIKHFFHKYDHPIQIIGTRHGEKLYESLISREEMFHSKDLGKYYKIPCDNRDLNYEKFFSKGYSDKEHYKDYTSHNTSQLNLDEVISLLSKINISKDI